MKFAIQCPECKMRLKLSGQLLGKKVKCKCGAIMRLPKSIGDRDSTDSGGSTLDSGQAWNPGAAAAPTQILNEMEDDLFGDELFANSWHRNSASLPPLEPASPNSATPNSQPALPASQNNTSHPAANQAPNDQSNAEQALPAQVMPQQVPQSAPMAIPVAPRPATPSVPDYAEPAVHPDSEHEVPKSRAQTGPEPGTFPYRMDNPIAESFTANSPPAEQLNYPPGFLPEQPQAELQPTRSEKESQLLNEYLEDGKWRNPGHSEFLSGIFGTSAGYGIGAGILLMLASMFLFLTGLIFNIPICFAPLLFMVGMIGTIVGIILLIIDKTSKN